jgi:hypothetical protein
MRLSVVIKMSKEIQTFEKHLSIAGTLHVRRNSYLQVGTTRVFSGHNPVIKVMLMIGHVGKLALLLLTGRMTS